MQKKEFQKCNLSKRVITFAGIILLCSQFIFSATGSFFGKKDIRVTKTQWFDIIYPPESEGAATILYENADRVYDEVAGLYDLTPGFRMPLVVTPAVDRMNAFWTAAPYNHIVIYDTSITSVGELSTYSETLLSVFRHELTHAVTNNMKNKTFEVVSKIFGDIVVPGMLMVSTGIAEGATLTSESAYGEGRLNDEYSKHTVKQAKLEGKFPSYYDVKGAGDKYPTGAPYYFNGAFHQWLQDTYGMPAYATFWYNLVNGKKALVNSCFKNAFGISIKKAWKQFAADYSIPDIPSNPLENSEIQDFFIPESDSYSKLNKKGRRYKSISASENSVFWLDSSTYQIQTVSLADLEKQTVKPKTLLNVFMAEDISISKDGRLLAITYYSENNAGESAQVKIYDLERNSYYTVIETGLKNAAIIQNDGEYYLVANKYVTPNNQIYIFKLLADKKTGEIAGTKEIQTIYQPVNTFSFEFTQTDNGEFAYIKKSGLDYSICIQQLGGDFCEYEAPKEGMVISSLSENEGKLYFSWAAPGTMPRLGEFEINSGVMTLNNTDISGGIFEPVAVGQAGEIVFTGHFYKENRLFKTQRLNQTNNELFEFDELEESEDEDVEQIEKPEEYNEIHLAGNTLEFEKYNPFNYLKRGIFIPVSIYSTEYFGCNSTYSSDTSEYLLGATYITGNPWTDGQNDLYTLTGGYNYLNNSFGVNLIMQMGTDTPLFSTIFDFKTEFDDKGWKLGSAGVDFQSQIFFGNNSCFTIGENIAFKIGRQDKRNSKLTSLDEFRFWDSRYFDCLDSEKSDLYRSFQNVITVGYSNIHRFGSARYEKSGVSANVRFAYRKDEKMADTPVSYSFGFNIYPEIKAYIPLPLPTKIELSILPMLSNFAYAPVSEQSGGSIFDFQAETILFGTEIQKALPLINALFANDFYISAGYALTLDKGDMAKVGFQLPYLSDYIKGAVKGKGTVIDSVYLKSVFEVTPNLGYFANSAYKLNLYSMVAYNFNTNVELKIPFTFYLGLQANF